MSFDTQSLIVAFHASEMAQLESHREQYGAELPLAPNHRRASAETVKTLLGHDDKGDGVLRAGISPTSVSARLLTDGRYAVAGHWSLALKQAWEAGEIQAEILTPAQLQTLTPQSDI
jgi:hypothetical protein